MSRYYQSNYESPGSCTHIIFSKKNKKKQHQATWKKYPLISFTHHFSHPFSKGNKNFWKPSIGISGLMGWAFRRFAYTTPKSFLELIKLYTSMVGQKVGVLVLRQLGAKFESCKKSSMFFVCFPGMLGWDLKGVGVGGNNEFVVGETKEKNQRKWKGSS